MNIDHSYKSLQSHKKPIIHVNYEQLTFGDQFNGLNGYTFATDEDLPANNFSFGDLSLGINYSFTPKARTSIYAGFALHHFVTPQISFYSEELDDDGNPIGDENLYPRISGTRYGY